MASLKNWSGVFIVFDGPNGSGKTTLIDKLCETLHGSKIEYLRTKEPTESELGKFIRQHQEYYSKESLACLVAADRYDHIEQTILPNLNKGKIVITDRYLPSSYVYQRMDGLDVNFIHSLNANIIIPDLTIIVSASKQTLCERLDKRRNLTRFEKKEVKDSEIEFYSNVMSLLSGWNVLQVENPDGGIHESMGQILNRINKISHFTLN